MRFPFHRWKNWHGMKGSVTSHTTLSSSSRIWAQFCAWPHPCGLRKMREGINLLTHLPSLSKGGLKRLPLTMLCRKLKGAETGALIPPWPHELYTWEATPPCSWLLIRRLYLEGRSGSGPCCHSIRAHPSQWGRSAGPPATRGLLLLCSVWAPGPRWGAPHTGQTGGLQRAPRQWPTPHPPNPPTDDFCVECLHDHHLPQPLGFQRCELTPPCLQPWHDPGHGVTQARTQISLRAPFTAASLPSWGSLTVRSPCCTQLRPWGRGNLE